MKNPLPLEASCWSECRPLFRMSTFIIFMQPQYDNFIKYYDKSFTSRSVMMRRIQNPLYNVEVYYLCSCHILIFKDVMKKPSPLEASWWAEFRRHLGKSKFVIFMQPLYVNFLKYYKKCFTTGSVMRSRIQSTFQNIEFY